MVLDTSAFLAVLNADDQNHPRARETGNSLVTQDTQPSFLTITLRNKALTQSHSVALDRALEGCH